MAAVTLLPAAAACHLALVGLALLPGNRRDRVALAAFALTAAALVNFPTVIGHLPNGLRTAVEHVVGPRNPFILITGNVLIVVAIIAVLGQSLLARHPKQKAAAALQRRGDILGAGEMLRQAGLLHDAFPLLIKAKAWQQAAEVALELGRTEEAAALFRRLGGRHLGDAARILRQAGHLDPAQQADQGFAAWLMQNERYDEAIEAWVRAGELTKATKAAALAIQENRLKASHTSFRVALRAAEEIRDHRCAAQLHELQSSWANAAQAWRLAGDHRRAAQDYRRAGNLSEAARAEVAAGRPREAALLEVEKVRRLLEKLRLRTAQGAVASGDRDRLEGEIQQELATLTPKLAELGLRDELIELLNAAGRVDEAVERLVAAGDEAAAAELARETEQWARAGELLERLERFGEASDVFELGGDLERAAAAAEHGLEFERALHIYRSLGRPREAARCLAGLGYLQEALKELHRVGEIGAACLLLRANPGPVPDIPDIIVEMALWLQANESVEQAIGCLQRAVRGVALRPNRLDPAVALARLLLAVGETAAARGHVERVLAYDYGHPGALVLRREIDAAISARDTAPKDSATTTGERRYEILSELGRGGMGVVYRARDARLERDVAIKVLRTTVPEEVQRLEQEAKLAATLNHPGIVTVFDFEPGFDGYFIAMELVEGKGLDQLLREDPARIQVRLPELLRDLAEAVAYAHSHNVVHRDLKPGNVLLTPDLKVKVLDFGIATRIDAGHPIKLTVVGTPYYMAPEQIRGEVPTPATDVYAFGATAFHLATGQPPFKRGNVIEAHLEEPPPDPASLAPGLGRELANIILKCLAKLPEERYRDAGELHRALAGL